MLPVVMVLAAIDIILIILYFYRTYANFGYIVSPVNVPLLVSLFSLALSPYFYYSDEAWYALGISNAECMRPYLIQAWLVNLSGYFLFFSYMVLRLKKGSLNSGLRYIEIVSGDIDQRVPKALTLMSIAAFVLICLAFNGGTFPLLNGNRGFYYESLISPVYLACTETIKIFGLYFGLIAVMGKGGWVYYAAAVGALLLTANRGPVITGLLLPVMVYAIVLPDGRKQIVRIAKTGVIKIIFVLMLALFLGLLLQSVRTGKGLNGATDLIKELLNGNTFSDIRDGAFLLERFETTHARSLVHGQTYLSGLLSFIPSSVFPFREEWSWGRFTTQTLAGWGGTHFGLRGGSFMEGYLNFGIIGIATISLVQAVIFSKLDSCFRKYLLNSKHKPYTTECISIPILDRLLNVAICTSGAYNVYVAIVILVVMQFLSLPYAVKMHRITLGNQ